MTAYKMAAVKVTPPNDFPLGLIRSHMVVIHLLLMFCDLQRVVRDLCPILYIRLKCVVSHVCELVLIFLLCYIWLELCITLTSCLLYFEYITNCNQKKATQTFDRIYMISQQVSPRNKPPICTLSRSIF